MKKTITSFVMALGLSSAAGIALAADIVVATAGPMTGQYASFGEQMRRGAEMAIADLNAAGGVGGNKLALEVGDDACDPKQAVAVANQLAGKGIKFIAGHFCSSSSIPASKVYSEEGIIQMTPASTNPQLTEQGLKTVFRVCGRDDQQGKTAAEFIQKQFSGKKIAIAHDKQTYSKGLADATKENLNKAGVSEVLYDTVNPGERDYSAFVTKLKQSGAEMLYYGGYYTELGLIVRQMADQGLNIPVMSGDALNTAEYWSITGAAGGNTYFTFAPDPRKKAEAKAVVEKFKATGYDPEGYTLYTYAAMQIWAEAANKAGSTDTDKIEAQLRGNSYKTIIGDIGFDAKGDRTTADYVVYQWKDGQYNELAAQ
jgi:branched-chain amino acid transport system substrate-binding protein